MAQKIVNGFTLLAYASQPRGGVPARAFIESVRRDGETPGQAQVFEVFCSRRFPNAIAAMSAASNALDQVRAVDAQGVPCDLPDAAPYQP